MGDSVLLGSDDVIAFVDAAEQHVTEMNRPDPVVDFLEADGVLLQRIGDEQQALPQADGARVGDALDEEMARILHGRQGAGIGAGRGAVERGGRAILERLMGPLVVIEAAEGVEGSLLGDEGGAGRANRVPFQGLVHSFVGAVLLGLGGEDALVLNAQAQPPGVELREAMNAGGREGTPLSVRIARGNAHSRNRRSKTGRTPWPFVESKP